MASPSPIDTTPVNSVNQHHTSQRSFKRNMLILALALSILFTFAAFYTLPFLWALGSSCLVTVLTFTASIFFIHLHSSKKEKVTITPHTSPVIKPAFLPPRKIERRASCYIRNPVTQHIQEEGEIYSRPRARRQRALSSRLRPPEEKESDSTDPRRKTVF